MQRAQFTTKIKRYVLCKHNFLPPPGLATTNDVTLQPTAVAPHSTLAASLPLPDCAALRKEVDRALESTSNCSAPGPDKISWKLLKAVEVTAIGESILAASLHSGSLPGAWREMRAIMIPKPGKDHTKVGGGDPSSSPIHAVSYGIRRLTIIGKLMHSCTRASWAPARIAEHMTL